MLYKKDTIALPCLVCLLNLFKRETWICYFALLIMEEYDCKREEGIETARSNFGEIVNALQKRSCPAY